MSEMTLKTNACRMKGMVPRILKNSMASSFPCGVAYGQLCHFAAVAVEEVYQRARHHHRREDGGEDPEAVHHRKAAHRAGNQQERGADDEGGDVGVENRGPGAVVAGVDRRLRRGAAAQLFAYALVDQNVRVD